MTRGRAISLLLGFLLALNGLTLGHTRGAAAATGQMVICSGTGTAIVYVDAEGQPTQAPHVCPECLVHLATTEPPLSLGEPHRQAIVLQLVAGLDRAGPPAPALTPPARAPPLLF